MKAQTMLFIAALLVIAVAGIVMAASVFPAPSPADPDPAGNRPGRTPEPVSGIYTNSTYGYSVAAPDGWLYREAGDDVSFLSPQGLEEVRVATNPLSEAYTGTGGNLSTEEVLEALNTTYIRQFQNDISGTEWVSTEERDLAGMPGYETVFSIPFVDEERYTFTIRYAVRNDVIYSVMFAELPSDYDPAAADVRRVADSFTLL